MIYVLSDIHGREDRFNSILTQIKLRKTDHLYILGDVIDRNPDGIHLLRRISRSPNMTMLLGNHECMMLDSLENPNELDLSFLWRNCNGGEITWSKWKYCSKHFQEEMISYLKSLPLNIEVNCNGKDWLLVHGAPKSMYNKTISGKDDIKHFAVWYRIRKYESIPETRTIIFGHTPTNHYHSEYPYRIYHGENRIGIDCGCAFEQGRLACLRLDDGAEFYSE